EGNYSPRLLSIRTAPPRTTRSWPGRRGPTARPAPRATEVAMQRHTFRMATAVATTAAVALAVSACGGTDDDGDGGTTGATGAEGQTLDVWIMQGTNPSADAFFDEVGTAFTEQTGAELNVEFVEWGDAHDRFVTSIAGGTTPDVAET